MGRALFSKKYAPAVTVRTDPEPTTEKWSRWNYFDPDSDEFFQNAQREVFTDTEEYRQQQQEMSNLVVIDGGADSPPSSETTEGDRVSPMAVGPDDPAVMLADAYSSADWEHRFLVAGAAEVDWRRIRGENQSNETSNYPRVIPLYIPRAFRNASTEGPLEQPRSVRTNRPRSVTTSGIFLPSSTPGRTDDTIPYEPSTPSLISSDAPSTPTDVYPSQMFTPSPAPSVTPHVYTWNRRAMPVPASPLATRGATGPLTNPNARMSMARVNVVHSPIRIQNAAI